MLFPNYRSSNVKKKSWKKPTFIYRGAKVRMMSAFPEATQATGEVSEILKA